MTDHPTADDIAAVLEEIGMGETFEPHEHSYYWDCALYEGDRRVGEGQAATPGPTRGSWRTGSTRSYAASTLTSMTNLMIWFHVRSRGTSGGLL
jgi:hypothetical protein